MIRILVNGALGRMGRHAVQAIEQDSELSLIATGDHHDNLSALIEQHQPQVIVDFTTAENIFQNLTTIIQHNIHPVIGTTGLLEQEIKLLQQQSAEKKLGGIIAPNFSIAAVLLMKYAADAARYYPNVEIIELHHDGKLDAPSGTAIKTANMIAAAQNIHEPKASKEIFAGSRGAQVHNIPIHAIRLPGLVAHEEVIFGGLGETLHLRHNTIDRQCFMPGLLLACKKVIHLKELVYGLEYIL
jgi:4-hydroxy-tetrahydrodipicolinate reductase